MQLPSKLRCLALLLALGAPLHGQAPAESGAMAAAEQGSETEASLAAPQVLVEGTHQRLTFDADVIRVAVGRSQTLSAEILTSREILLLGRTPGRTTLVVWLADGSAQMRLISVQPDLSLLRAALAEIHPSVTAELAPDRGAVVLRGLVPDVSYRAAAEAAAAAYLSSPTRQTNATPLVSSTDEGPAEEEGNSEVQPPEEPVGAAVINLIRLERLPALADEKIREAIAPLVGESVTVRRVTAAALPDDTEDLFVLEGSVSDQVTLSRVLFLASRTLLGEDADQTDIRVLADESGALTDVTDLFGAATVGAGGNQGNFNLGGSSGGQGGGSRNNQTLVNRIGANLGRAKVVEAAGGRVLAMIDVENLPLVRVDVRLYEVNLNRLRQWRNELNVLASDFDQMPLSPAGAAVGIQGENASEIAQDDLQNALSFLDGGVTNQSQLVSGGLAVDNLFSLLVNEQIARTLSRPTLTVLSGELALFQVGGQVPVPVAVTVGGGTDQVLNGVEFRDFGLQLSVRPLVEELDSETITLDLSPIVSLPDLDLTEAIGAATGSTLNTTAFETRATRTHTRLRDGQAMMIGGLISQRRDSAQGKTPLLGDLPLAGWLFRNEAEDADDSELVIVVNPVIVRPERPDARLWSFAEPAEVLAQCLHSVRPSGEAEAE
ncbi:MAG: pilus assembly protein N-terminal domain-containing protein [Planctomycetota bacterium]